MIPLRDENPTQRTAWVTATLIIANVLVWIYYQGAGMAPEALFESVCRFGMVPGELTGRIAQQAVELAPGYLCPVREEPAWETAVTSMFLHGSWLHLIANMWFLWLFGNNIEDATGPVRYTAFYLLAGLAGAAAHVFSAPASPVPTVGASGAVSGVMGAYLVLYPRVRIQTLFVIIIIIRILPLPAWVILIYWFALQLVSGVIMPAEGGGVAFWAHVGGFVAGAMMVKFLEKRSGHARGARNW